MHRKSLSVSVSWGSAKWYSNRVPPCRTTDHERFWWVDTGSATCIASHAEPVMKPLKMEAPPEVLACLFGQPSGPVMDYLIIQVEHSIFHHHHHHCNHHDRVDTAKRPVRQ